MKISIYELLGMIRDGKIPKKIIYHNYICYYDDGDYKIENDDGWLFASEYIDLNNLNDEVEIIEEPQEHKIPEKFKVHSLGDKDKYGNYVDSPFPTNKELMNKINEILDYLEVNNGIVD